MTYVDDKGVLQTAPNATVVTEDAITLTQKGHATRAQVAAVLMRFYQHVVE